MRGYGKACLRCRQKKRKCLFNDDADQSCLQCSKEDVSCQIFSKRSRTESSVAQMSTPTPPHNPSTGRSLRFDETNNDPIDLPSLPVDSHIGPHNALDITHDLGTLVNNNGGDEILLSTYFAWQCPQLLPVDERLFRNGTVGNPYWSHLLHAALCDQASRHIVNMPAPYVDRSTPLLLDAMLHPPTIPTVQALLIMAGRRLALGEAHTGWLFCGMAIRMLDGLDVDLHSHSLDEQSLMQRQLFWSAFCWDKFFALTLGRQPTLHVPTGVVPPILNHGQQKYWFCEGYATPQLSLEGETFQASCLLYQIIQVIIERLYGRHKTEQSSPSNLAFVDDTINALIDWRRHITPAILLDTAYLPAQSPPPHILTLNILYRTAWILLHRPLSRGRSAQSAHRVCVAKAEEIHLLFQLHERTFQLRNITYLVAYMAYVSATIDLLEMLSQDQSRRDPASKRLELTIRVLTQAIKHTPGIHRSLHHLRQRLQQGHAAESTSGLATPTTAHPPSAPTVDQVSAALLHPPQPPEPNPGLDWGLSLGLDELFDSLLPQYVPEFDPVWQDSTAYLPLDLDLSWLE